MIKRKHMLELWVKFSCSMKVYATFREKNSEII